MYGAYRVNTWNGEINVTNVVIPGENAITGVLYEPKEGIQPSAGVVLAHGIVNSKEALSGLALELAKHGYPVLSIDLLGHGRSGGNLDRADPSLGVIQAANYLTQIRGLEQIGLAGHSLGAGVSLYAASSSVDESGLVLIGGGLGANPYSEGISYSPNNLLVIIGRYDVLFDQDSIEERLEATFPLNTPSLDQLKGSPDDGSLTLLLMPSTSHLAEPVDPVVVKATVEWLNLIYDVTLDYSQTYLIREAFIVSSLILFVLSIAVAGTIDTISTVQSSFNWRLGSINGFFGVITFLPAMLLGNLILFPPQVFGSSIAWWLGVWGLLNYLLVRYRRKENRPNLPSGEIFLALAIFFASYLFSFFIEYLFGFSFRVIVPIFRSLTVRRSVTFFAYLPFMLSHFYSEAYLLKSQAGNLRFIVSKVGFFTVVVLLQYFGFFLFNTILVSGFIGFILEFLVGLIPLLLISSGITYWCARNQRLALSIVLNALLFSWISAGLFPY
jgi:dienelactone hydrolase